MAQAGYTPISLYYSTTAAAVPTSGNLVAGELALNTVDEKLYFKNSAGTVKQIAGVGVGGITYTAVKTANYTAVNNDGVQTNTTAGAFTVTLPATPSNGNQVFVVDSFNTWGTNNLTIGRNGSTIEGVAQDLVCDITGVSVQCVYNGTTWDIFAQVGGAGGSVVSGPASSTDNAIARFDSTTGKIIQNSVVTIADTTGNVAGVGTLSLGTTLGVGAATPSASGAGITFPATQSASTDANTLDDYEEGTFTPAITGSSTNPTVGYGNQLGNYTKIGNVVNFTIWIQWTSISGGSGDARFSGLPFTSQSGSEDFFPTSVWFYNLTYPNSSPVGLVVNNSTYLLISGLSSGGGFADVSVGNVGASGEVRFTGTYYV